MRRLLTPLLALLALAAVPAAASAAGDPHQWAVPNIGSKTMTTDTEYRFSNTVINRQLGHQDRTGVDLGWSSLGARYMLRREGRDHRAIPITSSQNLALFDPVRKRYLVKKGQTFGIDLDWSKTPKFEWRVEPRSTAQGPRFSLYNTAARDYVIYGERRFGINLVWSGNGIAHMTVTVARMPNEFPKGYAFFNGRTPLDIGDKTKQVQNVSGYPIMFRRYEDEGPGRIGAPSIVVPPGGLLVERDLEVIYGKKDVALTWIRAWSTADVPLTEAAFRVSYVDG